MRCRIRFGGRGHASNSLFLNINTLTSISQDTWKFENVIITCRFFLVLRGISFMLNLSKRGKENPPTVYWRAPVLFYACVFCVSKGRRLAQIWFDCEEGFGLCVPEGASGGTSANFLRLSTRLWRSSDGGPVHPTHHHPHHPEKPPRLPPSRHQQLQELMAESVPLLKAPYIWCIKILKFKAGLLLCFIFQTCGRVFGITLQSFWALHFSSLWQVEGPSA